VHVRLTLRPEKTELQMVESCRLEPGAILCFL
jgi:hypothetical protein